MRLIGLLLALVLAACAETGPTAAEKEARGISAGLRAAREQFKVCFDGVERLPEYTQLSDRFTFSRPSMMMLADKRKPTETDVALLLVVHKQVSSCRSQDLVNLDRAHPGFVTAMAASYAEADIDYAKLVRRDASWADYASLSIERQQRHKARWEAAVQSIGSNIKTAHANEVEQRRRAAKALADWSAAASANMPTFTQCTYVVGGLTCTSF